MKQLRDRSDIETCYSRLPWVVQTDREVTLRARSVYEAISSQAWDHDCVSLGLRWLSDCTWMAINTVRRCLSILERRGHIQVLQRGERGKKSVFRLTSAVFGSRAKTILSGSVKCDKCRAESKSIGASGLCAQCLDDLRGRISA